MPTHTASLDLRAVATHLSWHVAALERGHAETIRQVTALLNAASEDELDACRPAVRRLLRALSLGQQVRLRYARPALSDLLAS